MWEDDWQPLDRAAHDAQVSVVRELLGSNKKILDLGAGDGRIAKELVPDGHTVVAVDSDTRAIEKLEQIIGVEARCADMLSDGWARDDEAGSYDAAVCLGHTFMTVHDVYQAAGLLRRAHRLVREGGVLLIDVDCIETWRDVAEGNWQEGISEDGRWQLVWGEGDNIAAVRRAGHVDPDSWTIAPSDRVIRLWTMGGLRLLALATGWDDPAAHSAGVITMRRGG